MNKTFNIWSFLRADGNGELGYGHLSRLIALADLISLEFKIIFLTNIIIFFFNEIK